MKKTICDICNRDIPYHSISIIVNDGEHPHNGSLMTKNIDACVDCASKITDLRSNQELEDLRRK